MTESIVILGASFAGIGAAHYTLKHTLPYLPSREGKAYNVTLVNPSQDFYWRIAGPRAAVSKQMMPPSKCIYPIEPAFADYPKGSIRLIQGTATQIDAKAQTVSITTAFGEQRILPYTALVIATGASTPSPLFTQTTDSAALISTLNLFQKKLATAKEVVIGGGGPVGVEVAGEIAELLNGKPGFFASGPPHPKARITIICADDKMLPILRESISKTAERYLKRLGVDVVYNIKVESAELIKSEKGNGQTAVYLSDGRIIDADVYVDATGTRPNTSFLPREWLDHRLRVICNPKTLRVETETGEHVKHIYVVGDAGSYTRGGVVDMANAIPVAMTNLRTDLMADIGDFGLGESRTPGDRHYIPDLSEQQIAPIGTSKGVGAFGGWRMPSFLVWMIKGRDYMTGMLAEPTLRGDSFKKEGKWRPMPPEAAVGQLGLSSV